MRHLRNALLLGMALLAMPLYAQSPSPDSTQPKTVGEYSELLERLQSGDTTLDFSELRLSYAKSSDYRPYRNDISDAETSMRSAFKKRKFEEARTAADSILEKEYINLEAHLICALSSDSLGDTSKARFHDWVLGGLLGAILGSGDGQTQATAYHVLSVSEEYAALDALGLTPGNQSLVHADDGSSYDLHEVVDQSSGEKKDVYFDISLMMAQLDKMFR